MDPAKVSQTDVIKKALKILKDNHSVFIATTGGEFSPWILGAYYAEKELDILYSLFGNAQELAEAKLQFDADEPDTRSKF